MDVVYAFASSHSPTENGKRKGVGLGGGEKRTQYKKVQTIGIYINMYRYIFVIISRNKKINMPLRRNK